MLVERLIALPFSPKEYPVPARMVAIVDSLFGRLATIYTANDGEIVAVTMKPPLRGKTRLTGPSVSEILREVKEYQEPFESEPRRDAWVTIYTGPQPPKPVGERVPKLAPAM
jgi:hypothetical protein